MVITGNFISFYFAHSENIITLEYYEVISGRPNPKLRLNNEHFNLPITFNTFLPYLRCYSSPLFILL